MNAAPGNQPGIAGWGGPAREERAQLETLRDEADRTAAEAARTMTELAGRLSPRRIPAAGDRALKRALAAIPRAAVLRRPPALPVAIALAVAAAAVLTVVAVKKAR